MLTGTPFGREMLAQRDAQEQPVFDGFMVKPVTASMLREAVELAQTAHTPSVTTGPGFAPQPARLAGLHVLVAEDNATNQQVVRELLSAEGARVQIVADGAAAVQALQDDQAGIDLVLMDLQMPVMDGFTATSMIRSRLQRSTLPIIAMTANAMASDREACLAAGMNDHVGKPFELDHLVEVLRRHAPGSSAQAPAVSPAGAETANLPSAVDAAARRAGIDLAAALRRLGGRTDVYLRLMRDMESDLRAAPGQLRAACSQADAKAAAMLLHTLRGLVATLGADKLAGVLATGEARVAQCAEADAAALAAALEPALAALAELGDLSQLAQVLQDAEPALPAGAGAAPAQMRRALEILAEQLRHADMAATDTIAGMRTNLGSRADEQMQRLEAAVHALDFEAALRLCEAWREGLAA